MDRESPARDRRKAIWISGKGPGIAAFLAICFLTLGSAGGPAESGQPIAYNHRLHTQDLSIPCTTCHQGVETGERAGRPHLATCLECHESPVTENPEEHKIQQFAGSGREIPWERLTWIPDHVYFSHRRHVAVAQIECGVCHGPMEMQTTPPRRPLKSLRMSVCMDCHRKTGASVDCNACHR